MVDFRIRACSIASVEPCMDPATGPGLTGWAMDFLKIPKSFEEFVYEALTWLVLPPRTLFRILVAPARMTTMGVRGCMPFA